MPRKKKRREGNLEPISSLDVCIIVHGCIGLHTAPPLKLPTLSVKGFKRLLTMSLLSLSPKGGGKGR